MECPLNSCFGCLWSSMSWWFPANAFLCRLTHVYECRKVFRFFVLPHSCAKDFLQKLSHKIHKIVSWRVQLFYANLKTHWNKLSPGLISQPRLKQPHCHIFVGHFELLHFLDLLRSGIYVSWNNVPLHFLAYISIFLLAVFPRLSINV